MSISRIKVTWTGFQGAPGVSTFYTENEAYDLSLIQDFFDAIKAMIPNNVTITFPGTGDVLDETTGAITGTWTSAAPAAVDGTNASDYAAPVGMCVNWETGVVQDGRRLRGKTFLVPLSGDMFDTDGTPDATAVATLLAAAQTLATGSYLVVWHRPRAAKSAVTIPAVSSRAGGFASISDASVTDMAAVLTSRRD